MTPPNVIASAASAKAAVLPPHDRIDDVTTCARTSADQGHGIGPRGVVAITRRSGRTIFAVGVIKPSKLQVLEARARIERYAARPLP